jgi:hypothetical protein
MSVGATEGGRGEDVQQIKAWKMKNVEKAKMKIPVVGTTQWMLVFAVHANRSSPAGGPHTPNNPGINHFSWATGSPFSPWCFRAWGMNMYLMYTQ